MTDRYKAAADHIAETAGTRQGYCLVLESGQGRLAYELARRTDLRVIALEVDAQNVAASRKMLDWAGLYGSRITVVHGKLATHDLRKYFANLIVSDQMVVTGKTSETMAAMYRLLHPFSGVACLGEPGKDVPPSAAANLRDQLAGIPPSEIELSHNARGLWATIRRGPLPGAGEWTHLYGDASNRGSNQEKRVGSAMQIQWFGEPGGREMIDRHYRTTAPLSSRGRLFVPGNQCIYGVDAYNGYPLWRKDIPGFYRANMSTNCGSMVALGEKVYALTGNECRVLEAKSGEHLQSFYVPDNPTKADWGYLACVDDTVFGSRMSRPLGGFRDKTTSDIVFAMQADTGEIKWTYRCNGRIVNPAIAISHRHVYFVEVHDDQYNLVALDAGSGAAAWRETHDFSQNGRALHLAYADDTIAVTGAAEKWHIQVFSARDGSLMWHS